MINVLRHWLSSFFPLMSAESLCHTSVPPPLLASFFWHFRSLLTFFRTSESPCHISVPPPVLALHPPPRQSALHQTWGGHIQLPQRGMGHTQVAPHTHSQVVRVAKGRRSWGRRRRGREGWGAGRWTRCGYVAQGARILKFVVLGHRPYTFSKSSLFSDFFLHWKCTRALTFENVLWRCMDVYRQI